MRYLAGLLALVTFAARADVSVVPGVWDLYRGTTIAVQDLPSLEACAKAADDLNVLRSYTCRTRVAVTVTADAPPPPPPAPTPAPPPAPADNGTVLSWPAVTQGTMGEPLSGVTYRIEQRVDSGAYATAADNLTVTSYAISGLSPGGYTWRVFAKAGGVESGPSPEWSKTIAAPPSSGGVLFTDLASVPAGGWYTAYCADGSKATIFQAGQTASACGGTVSIPTHQGRVIETTPATIKAQFASAAPGDTFYLHAGNYSGVIYSSGWNFESNFDRPPSGAEGRPITIAAYPGEVATIAGGSSRPNFNLGSSGGAQKANYYQIANLNLIARSDCIDSGANTGSAVSETGAAHVRVVGVTCTITDATSNTMTGLMAIGGDDWKLLGNTYKDPANRTVINNNHVIYVQNGADDVEIAYNTLVGLHVGHVIQVHQDGGGNLLYERIHIHDNLLRGNSPADMRGITASLVADASTILVENNRIENVGQGDWGWLNVYRGQVTARGNIALRTQGGVNVNGAYGGTRRVILDDNQICLASGSRLSAENGASLSQITETNPRACP